MKPLETLCQIANYGRELDLAGAPREGRTVTITEHCLSSLRGIGDRVFGMQIVVDWNPPARSGVQWRGKPVELLSRDEMLEALVALDGCHESLHTDSVAQVRQHSCLRPER